MLASRQHNLLMQIFSLFSLILKINYALELKSSLNQLSKYYQNSVVGGDANKGLIYEFRIMSD